MKCRVLFLLLLGLLLGSATFTSERNRREIEGFELYTIKDHWVEKKEIRSISSIPIITQEGNLILMIN